MRGLTTADALAFYRTWYAPNNAVLVIAGDVTPEQVQARWPRNITGRSRRARCRRAIALTEPPKVAATRLTMKSAASPRSSWTRVLPRAELHRRRQRNIAYALQVLAEVLGGGATSRLYKGAGRRSGRGAVGRRLLRSRRRATSPTFGFYADAQEARRRSPISRPRSRRSSRRRSTDGVTAGRGRRAPSSACETAAIYARDSLERPGAHRRRRARHRAQLDDVQTWPERIGAVTLDEVNAAARLVIHDDIAVTGVLLPRADLVTRHARCIGSLALAPLLLAASRAGARRHHQNSHQPRAASPPGSSRITACRW